MQVGQETVVADKQTFIQAVLELERQETFQFMALTLYIEKLTEIANGLERLYTDYTVLHSKKALLSLFLSDREWSNIFTDALLEKWKVEFENLQNLSC